MSRLYVITSGSLEIRGLVSPGELPDLVAEFYCSAEQYGAKADMLLNGELIAVKGDVKVSLMVGATSPPMPSRLLEEVLEEVMERAFQ